jgi:hypothetical protein
MSSDGKLSADLVAILELISNGVVVSSFADDYRVLRLISLKLVAVDGDLLVATPLGKTALFGA